MSAYEERHCAEVDTEVFFPPETDRQSTAYAKSICAGCPWADGCLEFVLAVEASGHQQRHGVYAGMSPRQRADLARARAKETPATETPVTTMGPILNHGTRAGYRAHRRRKETACRQCLDAERIGSKAVAS